MDEKQDTGASLRDRATHEQSQQAVSAVPVGIPSANDWLVNELQAGIPKLERAVIEAERDLFWSRYWAGYLKAYEELLAQAMSASGQDPQGLEAKPASAVRQDAPEPLTPPPTIQGDSNV